MPTYDYLCDFCGHTEEIVQQFREKPMEKCPQCKRKKFRRLISGGIGLVFKGTGFYVTDASSAQPKINDNTQPAASTSPSESSNNSSNNSEKTSKTEKVNNSKNTSTGESTATKESATTKPQTKTERIPS